MIYNVIAIIIAAVVCFLFTQGVKASVDSIYNKAKAQMEHSDDTKAARFSLAIANF